MSQAPPPDFSAVITAIRRSGAAVRGAITQNTAVLRSLQQSIAQIGQPAPPPQETAAQKAARLLREAEARKQAAIQRRRDMLKRVGAGAMKYSGANAVGRGLRNIGRRITRAASSVFTWGTVITAALAYFVNSPFWNDFKELLADSTKEGGWLNTFIKSVKEFFQPLEGIGKDLLKGEFGKATDKIVDFFIDLMNKMIDGINSKLPAILKMDRVKTTEVSDAEDKAKEQAGELGKVGEKTIPGTLKKAAENALDKTPIIPALGPFSPSVGGVVEDLGVGTWFDGIATTARKVTGTLLTLEKMSDEQLSARQKELADMTDERYGERGATDLQMSVEELNKLGKSRMEVLAKFTEETDRRMAAIKAASKQGEDVTKKAGGGAIAKGVPYMVGEQGPELIIPNGAGTVKTASQTSQMMQAGANANSSNVRPVVPPPAPPVAAPVSRGPEANVQPNVQPPTSNTTIATSKSFRPTGMVPLLTGQAYP
jgi:hypothetical protein